MNNQPTAFDLNKIRYEEIRKALRIKFKKYSIAPVVIVALLALWFIMPMTLTHFAIKAYKRGDYNTAQRWLAPLRITSPERFVIEFNSGTVQTKLQNFDRAERELSTALSIAPPDKKCIAAQNLAASHRARSSKLAENNDAASDTYEAKALDVMKENEECFEGSAAAGGGSSSSSDSAQDNSPTEDQQQQLQQKEQEGRERQEQLAREEEYDASKPQIKPW